MKNPIKYLLIIFAVLLMLPKQSKANHGAGGEIVYEWLGDSTYRVYFKFYRDCTGPGAPITQLLCVRNSCNNVAFDSVMKVWPGLIPPGVTNGQAVSVGCSDAKTLCEGGTLPGFEEWWYYTQVVLPFQCNYWTFSTAVPNRNASMNLAVANNFLFYTEATFDNLHAQGNNSPYFSNKPVPYVCVNTPFTFNNGAVDVNLDSLTTEVINPLQGACGGTPLPMAFQNITGFPLISIPGNPIQTNNTWTLNASTGNMSFTPPLQGAWTLSVRTNEWRNGMKIGSILRDVQVQVVGGCSTITPAIQTNNVVGAAVVNGQVQGCAGQLLSFGYDMKSTDPWAILIGSDNHASSIPAATTTYTNQKTDSVRGTFSWTPTITQTGLYTLTVTVRDSTCRPPGIAVSNIFTIPIFIWPAIKASKDTTVCPGNPVQLSVTGGGNFTWSIIDGPSGSLSSTNGPVVTASPYATTTYMVNSGLTVFCNNKDTVKVTTLPSPEFTPLTDVITCPNVAHLLDLKTSTNNPGVAYSAKWSPATYLGSTTGTSVTATPAKDITYYVVISATNTQCKGFDTVKFDVLDGFRIMTPNTAICLGDKVTVNVDGDTRYTYTWSSQAPTAGSWIDDAAAMEPTITPTEPGVYKYDLVARYEGCGDSTASFTIDVQPIPTVTLPDDASMCNGDTMKIKGQVTPAFDRYTYSWNPGSALDNANILDPVFMALRSTNMALTVSTPAGCTGSDDINLTVFPADFVFLSADTSICPRDTVTLQMTGNDVVSFKWTPELNINDANSSSPSVYPTTTQIYSVVAIDKNTCKDTASVRVTVKPRAMLDLPETVKLYPGEPYQMQPQGNAIHFSWYPYVGLSNPNIANPLAKPEVNTRYFVTGITEGNCIVTDSIDVLIAPDSYIELPNAFTPGSGRLLKIIKMGDAKLKNYSIFNRWGQKVFETNDMQQGWDGTLKGEPQQTGVYVYVIEAESALGKKIKKQGNITLLR